MGPRYSIIPARFFEDDRLKPSHFKVMGYLGKHSDKSGWMKLSQTKAAGEDRIGIARETVCRAIADLVEWGYVEKRTKQQTKRSICFYRVIMDDRAEPVEDVLEIGEGCDVALTMGCDGTRHRVVTPQVTTVVTSDVTIKNDPSSNIKPNNGQRASARSEGSKSDFESGAVKSSRALPCFTIQPADTSWKQWIIHLRETGKTDLADEAEQSRRLKVSTRWPSPDSVIFEPKGQTIAAQAVTKRMTGDAA